jgi:hypothetical protein
MTARLFLGETELRVGMIAYAASCLTFEGLLLYHIRSPVRNETVFRIFVDALNGKPPVLTPENTDGLVLLSTEFGFNSLLSLLSDWVSTRNMRNSIHRIEERSIQQDRELCPLQQEVLNLREVNKAQSEEIDALRQVQTTFDKELRELRN